VMEEYRRRFGHLPDLPRLEFDSEKRGRFVAALERALQRNMPLIDYEVQEFEIARLRRLRLRLKHYIARLARRRTHMLCTGSAFKERLHASVSHPRPHYLGSPSPGHPGDPACVRQRP